MRKFTIALFLSIFGFAAVAQEIQHQAISINVEVPVRIFKGSAFIEDLTIDDFEVYEDGILQNLEAVYLIRKTNIERAESPGKRQPSSPPQLARHFLFQFEITDYLPKIKEALDEFFLNVLSPKDTLVVVTPLKTYNLKEGAFSKLPREMMAELLAKKIREDVVKGNAEYHSMIRELSSPLNSPELTMSILRNLRDYKMFDERGLLQTAEYLKGLEGQKHIFLFYQKEGIPISKNMEIFDKFELIKNVDFDEDRIREAFSDSSVSIHFLYITKENGTTLDIANPRAMRDSEVLDQSAPIYGAFKEMAQVTGGISEASQDIAWSFNRAVLASENYYLLYYSPRNYKADGKFKRISVKVKGQNYHITHRSGYIAD